MGSEQGQNERGAQVKGGRSLSHTRWGGKVLEREVEGAGGGMCVYMLSGHLGARRDRCAA